MPIERYLNSEILHIFAYIGIVIGLIQCFWGYKYFRVIISIAGFFGGFLVVFGAMANYQQQIATSILVGLIGGVIGIGLMQVLYRGVIFLLGGLIGGLIGYLLYNLLNIPNIDPFIIPVIVGFFTGLIALKYSKEIIIIVTAFSGAESIIQASYFLSFEDFYREQDITAYFTHYPSAIAFTLIIGTVGALYQFRDRIDLQYFKPNKDEGKADKVEKSNKSFEDEELLPDFNTTDNEVYEDKEGRST